jgi:hypothetical protein
MWQFSNKGKAAQKTINKHETVLDVLDKTVDFVGRLHALGGFGYVLFGSSVALVMVTIVSLYQSLEKLEGVLISLAVGAAVMAIIFVIADKLLAFHAASIKLRMVARITEMLVEASIPKDRPIESAVVRDTVRSIIMIWSDENRSD